MSEQNLFNENLVEKLGLAEVIRTRLLGVAPDDQDVQLDDADWRAILAALDSDTPRKKVSYVGAPACFALELACKPINAAFGGYGCYLVGSALERADWRDVDVRYIMSDEEFAAEFPAAKSGSTWEFDPKWILLTTGISAYLSKATGLPVDFQFQPQSHANDKHKGRRHALGLEFSVPD